ncbi:MAG: hypothetical protein ABWZ99_01015, partial [Ilumatobacteraceae bacterium]
MTKIPRWSKPLVLLPAITVLAPAGGMAAATTVPAAAECPDGDSVPIASPYEANPPAGENWRLGIEMAVA